MFHVQPSANNKYVTIVLCLSILRACTRTATAFFLLRLQCDKLAQMGIEDIFVTEFAMLLSQSQSQPLYVNSTIDTMLSHDANANAIAVCTGALILHSSLQYVLAKNCQLHFVDLGTGHL